MIDGISTFIAATVLLFYELVTKACKKIGKGGTDKQDDQ